MMHAVPPFFGFDAFLLSRVLSKNEFLLLMLQCVENRLVARLGGSDGFEHYGGRSPFR